MSQPITITIAELRLRLLDELAGLPDDTLVFFGQGDLSFYRLKNRGPVEGPALYQIEFDQAYAVTAP